MPDLLRLAALYLRMLFLAARTQDVPGTFHVLVVSVSGAVLSYALAVWSVYGLEVAFGRALLDLLVMSAVLHGALRITGKPERFAQAFAALCGTGTLLALLVWPFIGVLAGSDGKLETMSAAAQFALLFLQVWGIAVVAHIFRHSLDAPFSMGVLVAILYAVASYTVTNFLIPPTVPSVGS